MVFDLNSNADYKDSANPKSGAPCDDNNSNDESNYHNNHSNIISLTTLYLHPVYCLLLLQHEKFEHVAVFIKSIRTFLNHDNLVLHFTTGNCYPFQVGFDRNVLFMLI